jgi:hypothetical protein
MATAVRPTADNVSPIIFMAAPFKTVCLQWLRKGAAGMAGEWRKLLMLFWAKPLRATRQRARQPDDYMRSHP